MNWNLYLLLSAMMGVQYAIWGAWSPILAARLLGPLGFSGKQTGWIYGTLPLACIVAPLISGQLADQHVHTEHLLAGFHLAGAALMFVAARQRTFGRLLAAMLGYSACYAATLPLVNALMFRHVTADTGINVGHVFMWAPIAWALAGYGLTAWRWKFKTGEQGADGLYLAAGLSVVMAVTCLFLPATPPANAGTAPILDAFAMLKDSNFLIFVLVSMAVAGLMQFYFLGTAPFLQRIGISVSNVPATMAIAQAVQTIATFVALGLFIERLGYKTTLILGALCWTLLYALYVAGRPRALIVAGQSLHGLAYVFFIIAGQILADTLATDEMRSSMQGLIFAATTGLGLFLGTQLAGATMDRFKKDGAFQWSRIFLVPCIIAAVSTLIFALGFRG
jgi:nucleoside transporter